MRAKYKDFVVSAPRLKDDLRRKGQTRAYVGITCPHFKMEFVELPCEAIASNKASKCKQHLGKCKEALALNPTDATEELRSENARLRAELETERSKSTALVAKGTRLSERNESQGQRLRSVEQQLEQITSQLGSQAQWHQQVSLALGLDGRPIPRLEVCVDRITKMSSGKKRLREQLARKEDEFRSYKRANEHTDKLVECLRVFTEHPDAAKAFLRGLSKHAHPDKHRHTAAASRVATGMQQAINYLTETL